MTSLREAFGQDVSSTAFRVVDGEPRIVGKFGQISLVGEYYDIWLVQPDIEPLTERKITAILKSLPLNGGFTRLTGEAFYQTKDKNFVLKTLKYLGIRKKRRVTPEESRRLSQIRRLA